MRICFLADPASIHTRKWVRWFAENGHEVHLIHRENRNSTESLAGVIVHLMVAAPKVSLARTPYLISDLFKLRQTIKKIKPDIVHAHFVSQYGIWGAFTGFHPFVVTAWGSDILVVPERIAWVKILVKKVLKTADSITCDAQHIVQRMIEFGAQSIKIQLIYFGVDTRKFHPDNKDLSLREKLRIPSESPVIISTRSLNPIYDIATLINSIPLILEQIPEAKFLIIGTGEQASYLQELATSLGIANSVRFIGTVANDHLPGYLTAADVYVSTALSDGGIAASTAEAMACGLPVVITDFGNNKEWVQDGEGGYLVPLKQPSILAEKIIHLLKSAELRKKFGNVNRETIDTRNSYHREMKKMEGVYQTLLGKV